MYDYTLKGIILKPLIKIQLKMETMLSITNQKLLGDSWGNKSEASLGLLSFSR